MNFPLLRALWEHPEMNDSLQQFWVQQGDTTTREMG